MTCGLENDPYCELTLDRQRNAGEDTLAVFVKRTVQRLHHLASIE